MISSKWFYLLIGILFLVYVVLYFTQITGYYEYSEHNKMKLTEEEIKRFEEDVKNGKNIDLEDYMTSLEVSYENEVSKSVYKLGKTVEKLTKLTISKVFGGVEKALL